MTSPENPSDTSFKNPENKQIFSVMQSYRDSSRMKTLKKLATYEAQVKISLSFEQQITFARHKYGRVEAFRIKMGYLVHKFE